MVATVHREENAAKNVAIRGTGSPVNYEKYSKVLGTINRSISKALDVRGGQLEERPCNILHSALKHRPLIFVAPCLSVLSTTCRVLIFSRVELCCPAILRSGARRVGFE